jgi:hypothetical protein
MIKYKKVKVTDVEPVIMICDICKKEYDLKSSDELEIQEFCHINFIGGYSSVFGDGVQVECDICQHCLQKLIGQYCRKIT